ncbi:cyclase family protein [Paenibacillus sp.]|uniref:cyclase family protein n=1 Tax=Paenibacillus sp. TaxID=58172 RepID=UPI002D4B825F|nr:cyclase family protein [Paenibacillus sp.]HZG55644.1 cyclase family protein [Paenibacillus sp.]
MNKIMEVLERLDQFELVDLTHPLEEDMPVYPSHSRYFHTLWDSSQTGSLSLAYQLIINEHCGTHMDATAHFLAPEHPAHRYMSETDPRRFFGRARTLDFSSFSDRDLVSVSDIRKWEERHHPIEAGDIVLFRFGWDRYWKPRSVDRTYTDSWPGISEAAASYVVEKSVKAVGCDTLAIDSSYADRAPAHYVLLGNGVNIIENLTRLDRVSGESLIFALPLKIKEGSGSPIRALAFVEKRVPLDGRD